MNVLLIILFFLLLGVYLRSKKSGKAGTAPIPVPKLQEFASNIWSFFLENLVPVVILGLAVFYTLWPDEAKTCAQWARENWVLTTTMVGVGFWFLNKRGHHHHSGHGGGIIANLKGWLIPLGGLVLCYCIGVYLMNYSEQSKRRVDLAEEKYAREAAIGTPPPTMEVRMGTWNIVLAPGECSEWVEYFKGSSTTTDWKTPVLVERGRRDNPKKEIVPSGIPIRLFKPGEGFTSYAGQALRFYAPPGTTSNAVIVVTRTQ